MLTLISFAIWLMWRYILIACYIPNNEFIFNISIFILTNFILVLHYISEAVNGVHLYSACCMFTHSHSHSHTQSYTLISEAAMQGANKLINPLLSETTLGSNQSSPLPITSRPLVSRANICKNKHIQFTIIEE